MIDKRRTLPCNECRNRSCKVKDAHCRGYVPYRSYFRFSELVLEHPQGLIDTERELQNTGLDVRFDVALYV